MTFISVLFPAPFSPISACTSPSRNSRSTPSSAIVGPNDLEIFVSLSASMSKLSTDYTDYVKEICVICGWVLFSQHVVKRLGGLYASRFVRGGDCQDAHVVVVR